MHSTQHLNPAPVTKGENMDEKGNKDRKRAVPKQAGVEDTSETILLMSQVKISLLGTDQSSMDTGYLTGLLAPTLACNDPCCM